jgi:hypothetical protein
MEGSDSGLVRNPDSGKSWYWLVSVLAGAVLMLLAAQSAWASPPLGPDDHCRTGDATAIEQAFYPSVFGGDPADDPFVAETSNEFCSFRTFITPDDGICFCEHDIFTGGTVFVGFAEDRNLLGEIEFDFTLNAPGGPQWTAFDTPVKAARYGTVWRQFGIIFTDAVPGSYELESVYTLPEGEELLIDDVSFTVLPHESAHDLGQPDGDSSILNGSVNCPPTR